MLERLVENWLTRASERALEVPFCQMLSAEGHQVIHLSRHGPFEQGKDILTIDPGGIPCAFQLKSIPEKLTQRQWAKFVPQVNRLVEIPITHPSIDIEAPRQVYFVVNGELEEEVREEIADRNRDWVARGLPRLRTIVRGEILARFKALQTDFWPTKLAFERDLLELFTSDGRACLDKAKVFRFLSAIIGLDSREEEPPDIKRLLPSTAIFASYALSRSEEESNHVAIVEGWTILASLIIGLAEKHDLAPELYVNTLDLCLYAVESAMKDLVSELKDRKHFVEGNALVDAPFFRGRMTWLLSLVSMLELTRISQDPIIEIDEWAIEFLSSHLKWLHLWGDAAFPQFLAIFFFLNQVKPPNHADQLLFDLIDGICTSNSDSNPLGLPDPYHDLAEVVGMNTGIIQAIDIENFKGRSYSLEPIVQMCARRGWRQRLSWRWQEISRIDFAEFNVNQTWQFCLWDCDEGRLKVRSPGAPQSWAELRDASRQVDPSNLPEIFRTRPWLLLLFLLVFPHRITTDVVKFLDDYYKQVKIDSRRVSSGAT